MNAFPHDEAQKNIPGFDTFFFCNAASLADISITNNVATATPSMGGAVFYEGYSTYKKLEVGITPKQSEEGTHYEVSVKGIMPKLKSNTLVLFEEMLNKYFNLIVRTNNGKYLYLGAGNTNGLNFTYKQIDTGYEFEFYGSQMFAPPYFTGTIPQ